MRKLISIENMAHNFRSIQDKFISEHLSVIAVVKSNAYGHGIDNVVPQFNKLGIFFFAVADVREAFQVKACSFSSDILIFQPHYPPYGEELFVDEFVYSLSSLEMAHELAIHTQKTKKRIRLHITIDTGLCRLGMMPHQISKLIKILKKNKYLVIEGIFSHCAISKRKNLPFADKQEQIFISVIQKFFAENFYFKYIHFSNSFAVFNRSQHPLYNRVRLGGSLYGIYPNGSSNNDIKLYPVMTVQAKVLSIKEINKGQSVGYNCQYVAFEKMRIAVIDAGYTGGIDYRMSSKGKVLINNKKRSIIGAVSMSMLMIRLERDDQVSCGDEVILIGSQGEQTVRVEDIARNLKTVPYDVLCKIGNNIPILMNSSEFVCL